MAEAETVDGPLSAGELVGLNAHIARQLHDRASLAARAAPKSAPLPPDHPARRKSLGLAPGVGSSEPIADELAFVSGVPSVAANLSAETRAAPATMADVAEALDAAVAINLDGDGALRARIGELRNQVSELKAALVETRHEVRELKLISGILAHLDQRRIRTRRRARDSWPRWPRRRRARRPSRRARRERPTRAEYLGMGGASRAV